MNDARRSTLFSYENGLLLLLGFSFGVAFVDRNAATILGPFIRMDLGLDNTELALLGSGLALSWAVGAFLVARWSDAVGRRKPFLVAFLLIFSACSFLSGFAPSFGVLLASRVVMGFVEGPFLPVCLALMMAESSEHRRGLNAGVMQNLFAALLGQSLAPIVLVPLAQAFDWRAAFYVAGVPGLLCALAVAWYVREPAREPEPARAPRASAAPAAAARSSGRAGVVAMLASRNILLCSAISVCMVAWLIMGWTFLPTYLVENRALSPATMQWIMSALGICTAISGFGAPWLSDRIGRKPVMIAFCFAGAVTPLATLYFPGAVAVMTAIMFIGWLGTGAFPLFMGVIPGETVSRAEAATAMGLIVCVGEIAGGFGITTLAGKVADLTSLAAPFLFMVGCTAAAGVLCLFLEETAPAKRKAPAAMELAQAA
ncbi:MAG TPA: MFS transporter [Gammaproteobacteria bacterium]|nr:MFS transporter [Gammaproteobacteria bacterium]